MSEAAAALEEAGKEREQLRCALNRGVGFLESHARDARVWAPDRAGRLQEYANYFADVLDNPMKQQEPSDD